MSDEWIVKPGGGNFEKAPPGNHPAVLVAIVDMGHQWVDGFQGAAGKYQHRAYFVWELVTKKQQGMKDRNILIATDLTLSFDERAKLAQWVAARTGKAVTGDYNIALEVGQPCLLNVVDNNGYPKIKGVSGVPDGLTVPAPQNKPFIWKLTKDRHGKLNELPDWLPYHYGRPLAEVIAGCKEIAGDTHKAHAGGGATGATSGYDAGPVGGPGTAADPIPF